MEREEEHEERGAGGEGWEKGKETKGAQSTQREIMQATIICPVTMEEAHAMRSHTLGVLPVTARARDS